MRVLVLAGGADQIALIQELSKRDTYIILIDFYENPPAKSYVHKHYVTSTLDDKQVKAIAISEKVDLITTACTDQALLTVSKVSEELNLPCYISYLTALNVTNKSYMKEKLKHNNIPTAKYAILKTHDINLLIDYNYPLVVKPVDCNSSKGVKKVTTKIELVDALTNAINFSRTKTAIVEEFKEGEEISVDAYIDENTVKILSITGSNKIKNNNDSFTIIQSYYPYKANYNIDDAVLKIVQQIADAFNLKNTPLLIQMIHNNDEFSVLEFSARMGGGSKYKLIEVLSGVDIMKIYVDLILGNHPSVHPQKMVNYALMNYVYCYSGVFDSLLNFDVLKERGVISEYFLYKPLGMEILKAETSSDRPAGFLLVGESVDEISKKMAIAKEKLMILDNQGKDIMKHDIY